MISAAVLDELRQIAGPEHVRTDADTIRENSTDATKSFHPADVIVFVENAAQVSQIVRLSNRESIPVVSRGGGVGYAGGAIPIAGGIVISMRRMNRILEINPIDLLVVLEPGVITDDLHQAVEAMGLFYPPDPASLKQSSIGGNVAHNAGGPRAFKYGVTRQYLLGLDVVLPTGELISTGGRVVKNAVAYDLTDLMCGSEGTLGIITKLTMRLLPKPEAAFTLMALFDSVRSGADAANWLIAEGIIPSKLELVDRQSLAAIRAYIRDEKIETKVQLPAAASALLLVEVDGDRRAAIASRERVRQSLGRSALEIQEAGDGSELWAIRRYLSPAVGRIRPNKINEDIVVPRSRVPDYLEAMEKLQGEIGLPIVCFGHVGDGNMHVNVMIDASDPSERERGDRAKRRIFELAVEMGGTISGEHGIGIMKSEFLHLALQPDAIAAMKRIKAALDPNNILNPGKIFPCT
ncbi:MAG TPA: FAD-linked oxidase C-terminal domain-containing protein [Terriglobia bacterium]|nr:FAD-linked oxidase C-terminal domain-containing protein [Terriglobia bacterium]